MSKFYVTLVALLGINTINGKSLFDYNVNPEYDLVAEESNFFPSSGSQEAQFIAPQPHARFKHGAGYYGGGPHGFYGHSGYGYGGHGYGGHGYGGHGYGGHGYGGHGYHHYPDFSQEYNAHDVYHHDIHNPYQLNPEYGHHGYNQGYGVTPQSWHDQPHDQGKQGSQNSCRIANPATKKPKNNRNPFTKPLPTAPFPAPTKIVSVPAIPQAPPTPQVFAPVPTAQALPTQQIIVSTPTVRVPPTAQTIPSALTNPTKTEPADDAPLDIDVRFGGKE